MGYTTEFDGAYVFSRQLTAAEVQTLNKFVDTRHEESSRSYSSNTPGYYCQWVPSMDGKCLHWNGGEKFYEYVEWLNYLIKNFFVKWDVKLNGQVRWQGEEMSDAGYIVIENSKVTTRRF